MITTKQIRKEFFQRLMLEGMHNFDQYLKETLKLIEEQKRHNIFEIAKQKEKELR